jgi:hypothetical protein
LQRAVEGDIVKVEADDPVERGECFGLEGIEQTGLDPLVAPSAQGHIGHLVTEDRFDVDPRGAGHQPDEQTTEAQPVRDATPVTAQRMRPIRRWATTVRSLPRRHRPPRAPACA